MNFVRANIVFVIVMSLALLGALYLIYLDISIHSVITEANEVTRKSNEDFERSLRTGKNRPVDLNVKMIDEDTRILSGKVKQLQRIFGAPYRAAMLDFAKALNVTEDDLRGKMKRLYEDENNKIKTPEKLVPLLFQELAKEKKLTPEQLDSIFRKTFAEKVQKKTLENLDRDLHVGRILLGVSLGLSRQMVPTVAWDYLRTLQAELSRRGLIPGVKSLAGVQNFTYNEFVVRPPSGADVEDILEVFPIYEDLFCSRMEKTGIVEVVSLTRSPRQPQVVADVFREYRFEMTFRGSTESVREFCKRLLEAHKENRVYILNWVSIVADDSIREVEEARKNLSSSARNPEENMSSDPGSTRENRRRSRRSRKKKQFYAASERKIDPGSKDYAKVLIGAGKNVTATIKFSYFIYVGERLSGNRN